MKHLNAVDRMLDCMNEKHIRDVDLYTAIGVSKQRFGGWKTRGSIPKDMLEPVAKTLNVSLEWLMTGKDPKRSLSVKQRRVSDMMKRNGIHAEDLELLTRGKVSAATIEQWLSGSSEPTDAELSAVAPHLGMPPDYFRTGVTTIKHHGGPDRRVVEMPEGYDLATPAARKLAETIIRMSAVGSLDDKQLAAISQLLDVPHRDEDARIREMAEMTLADREVNIPEADRLKGAERKVWIDRMVHDYKIEIAKEPEKRKAV